jgi:hypothetical protein
MSEEFIASANAHVNRADRGVVRDVLHNEDSYVTRATTVQFVAHEYLEKHHQLLGIPLAELRSLGRTPDTRPGSAGVKTWLGLRILIGNGRYRSAFG